MSWRLAESLKTLREQINAGFPNRSKISDGSIGDTAHAARKSDHNPNEHDVVCAIDITHDPKNGIDCNKLADVLDEHEDNRIAYVIWNGRILKARTGFKWEKYTGKNKHNHHLHISVKQDARAYDDGSAWNLNGLKDAATGETKVVRQEEPVPYGFGEKIKSDFKKLAALNITTNGLAEYAKQGQSLGLPSSFFVKLVYLAIAISIGWLLFRFIHYLVDSWKQNKRHDRLAQINTNPELHDLQYVKVEVNK